MKIAMPGTSRLNQALRALPRAKTGPTRAETGVEGDATEESFRLLALNTRILLPDDSNRGVVVMSAFPGDGRSYIAAHLAVALAEKGPALLVAQSADAATLTGRIDARRNGSAGAVPDALKDTARSTDYPGLYFHALQHTGGGLSEIVAQASAAGFHTVVDSPSALTSSNAFLLAREVGNVIYVVTEKVQDLDVHRQIRDQLNRLGVGILGLVLNRG